MTPIKPSNKDFRKHTQLLTPIKELGLEWKCDGEASWWKNYWFRNQLFCAWHIILGNHRCCQTSRNLFPGCCCCLHWGDKHLLHSSNSLNSARICFKQCGVTLCFIRKHHCNPGIQSPALEISNSAPVKCGESSARVVIEMLWEEQPSTGRGKNSTSGTAGSSFLEKLQPSSEPVHFRATWTQMHMFCHAWVDVTGRCMLVTLHVGKRESIQTQQIRRTYFLWLVGKNQCEVPVSQTLPHVCSFSPCRPARRLYFPVDSHATICYTLTNGATFLHANVNFTVTTTS